MKRKEKLIGMFMVLFAMISMNAWGHSTHNGSVSVTAKGNGTVYISNSDDGTDIDGVTTENGTKKYSWNCGGQSSGDSKTFVLRAVPTDGYVFTGWTGSPSISGANANVTVDASSSRNNNPSYTANFAEGHTYYTRVKATAVGTGLVYVGTKNNPTNEEYGSEIVADNEVFQASAPSARYYWVAKEIDGSNYKFVGWYDNPECTGNAVSTNATLNISNLSGVEGDGEYTARYAKFVPYETYYSSVTVVAQEGGTVYVSNGQGEPNMNDYTTMTFGQNSTTKNVPSHSYTLYAQANPGYEFRGWVYNNGNPSTNNTVSFNANSTNEAEPTSRTYTAVFVKKGIWNWEKPTIAAGSTEKYYIYNPTADKFLGNNNSGVDAEEANVWKVTTNGEGTTCTISDDNGNSLFVQRLQNQDFASATLNIIDPNKFAVYSEQMHTSNQPISDTFWYKSTNNGYTLNVYIQYYNKLTGGGSDKFGDVYVGMNGTNLAPSNSQNATGNHWYFVTEEEMAAYKEYVAAYNRAVEIVTEIPKWGETKNTLNGIINANVPSQLSTAADNTAALNSIKKVPLNVNTMGSFVAPFDVTLPNGVTAWITTDSESSDGYLTITQTATEGTLPANTPVILRGTGSQTYYGIAEGEENANGNGFLVGVYKETTVPQGNYVLQKQTDEIMLYEVESDDIKLKAYRAYLNGSQVSGSKLRLVFSDETTGIATVEEEASVSAIYSASGAKLNAMQKGLNIIKMSNGSVKKVMVK